MKLKVNGAIRDVDATADRPLLGILRDELELTGFKYGCGEGECGACTVLIDGKAMRSCRLKTGGLVREEITTIESISLVNRTDLPSAGAGETPIVGIAPAVANAVFAATGVRKRTMPMGPVRQ